MTMATSWIDTPPPLRPPGVAENGKNRKIYVAGKEIYKKVPTDSKVTERGSNLPHPIYSARFFQLMRSQMEQT